MQHNRNLAADRRKGTILDKFVIHGGQRLNGSVSISGSKNGALPVLFSTLLCDGPVQLSNVPIHLRDIEFSLKILEALGVESEVKGDGSVRLQVIDPTTTRADYDLVSKMRASICCLGPLLARRGEAVVSLPGGCSIGDRPIELHTHGMEALGADVRIENGYVVARAERLKGATIYLSGPMGSTVLGTQNVMMAAVGAEGVTVIEGAACEPEVQGTASFLRALGVEIEGDGTPVIRIEGRGRLDGDGRLDGACFEIPPDRIETGTYLLAGQIDAAINPGNSGGPVIVNKQIVGVVMQANSGRRSENLGYFVPPSIIRHVLDDRIDGSHDGFPDLGFRTQTLDSPSAKLAYGLRKDQSGVLVIKVFHGSPAQGLLEENDVILKIDHYDIADDGSIKLSENILTDYKHAIDIHHIGESVLITYARNGEVSSSTILAERALNSYSLVAGEQFDKIPEYYIYGGVLFVPLNMNLLKRWGKANPPIPGSADTCDPKRRSSR